MTEPVSGELRIDSRPAKAPYIDVLTRDIGLLAAIIDLVDNTVDGARSSAADGWRPKPGGAHKQGSLSGFNLEITVSANSLILSDNCGGISLKDAEDYAFKFGTDTGRVRPHSIGQFGVGMKRAFFKLGKAFSVHSVARDSRFDLNEVVEDWLQSDDWSFVLTNVVADAAQQPAEIGTTIEISPLADEAAEELGAPDFPLRLKDEITARHQEAVDDGLGISVGDMRVPPNPARLLVASDIKPVKDEFDVATKVGEPPVRVRIVCGIGPSSPGRAGWDVLCNGRAVVRSDQSRLTGWGGDAQQVIPSYHNQFARFRGFVFFDCPDASLVPWTTTKTEIATDSPVWRAARQQMVLAMRPVIDFLNALDREADSDAASTSGPTLASRVESAKPTALAQVAKNPVFIYPTAQPAPRVGRISYSKPKPDIDRLKRFLRVSSAREVGERTFDYFVEAELD